MINYILPCFCFLLASCTSNTTVGQNGIFDTAQVVAQLKKDAIAIDSKISTYNIVEKEINGESAEGGVLTGYFDKTELKKIVGIYYGETGKRLIEYYKEGGLFIYVRSKTFNYKAPLYVDTRGIIKDEIEDIYYFDNENLIMWQEGNIIINYENQDFLNKSNSLKESFDEYKTLFSDYTNIEESNRQGDTIRCRYAESCQSTGFIIKGSRNKNGSVQHVPPPANKNVAMEE